VPPHGEHLGRAQPRDSVSRVGQHPRDSVSLPRHTPGAPRSHPETQRDLLIAPLCEPRSVSLGLQTTSPWLGANPPDTPAPNPTISPAAQIAPVRLSPTRRSRPCDPTSPITTGLPVCAGRWLPPPGKHQGQAGRAPGRGHWSQ